MGFWFEGQNFIDRVRVRVNRVNRVTVNRVNRVRVGGASLRVFMVEVIVGGSCLHPRFVVQFL